jgi:hypothetical protein
VRRMRITRYTIEQRGTTAQRTWGIDERETRAADKIQRSTLNAQNQKVIHGAGAAPSSEDAKQGSHRLSTLQSPQHHNSSNQRIYGIDLIQILDSQPPGLGHAHTHSLDLSVDIWHASLCSPTLRARDSVRTLDQAAVHVRFHTSRRIPSARNCNQCRSVTWPSWRCSRTIASNEAETGTCAMNTHVQPLDCSSTMI